MCVFSVCMDVQVCTHVHLLLRVLYGVHTCACVPVCVCTCMGLAVCVCARACLLLGSVFLTAACTHRHGAARLPHPCKFNPWPGILEETPHQSTLPSDHSSQGVGPDMGQVGAAACIQATAQLAAT